MTKIRDYRKLQSNHYYLCTDSLGEQHFLYYRGAGWVEELHEIALTFWANDKGDVLTIWVYNELQEAELITFNE